MLSREQVLETVGNVWWGKGNKLVEFIRHHLTREGAKIFALEHCAFAARFPQWFGNIIGNCPFIEVRRYMIENMFVEEVQDPTIKDGHYESLVKFGIGLGLSREEVVHYEPSITMQMALSYWDHISRTRPWVEALAGIGGLEISNHGEIALRYGERPIVFGDVWAPLKLPPEAMTHWAAAEVADPHEGGHGEETVRIICEYARTPEQERGVLATLKQSLSVFRFQYDQIGLAAIEASQKAGS